MYILCIISDAVVTLAPAPASLQRVNASTAEAGETVQIITTDASGNIVGQGKVSSSRPVNCNRYRHESDEICRKLVDVVGLF